MTSSDSDIDQLDSLDPPADGESDLPSAKGREAYERIERGIETGRYPVGARLKEAELAEDLGMSRTPVREAIRALERDGLVATLPNRGATVRGWTTEAVEEAYELRAAVEGFCASRAAVRMDANAVRHLTELHAEFERQLAAEDVDVDAVIRLNRAFHAAILKGSGNTRAAALLPQATDVPRAMKRAFWRSGEHARNASLVYHGEIVESIRVHDAVRAEAVMRSHLYGAKDFFIEYQRSMSIERLVQSPEA